MRRNLSETFQYLRLIPNQLTAIRFFAVPVMWIFALRSDLFWIGIGFIISLVTDLLDGAAARRLDQTTEFGSKFDSLSDQVLQISAVFWIFMVMPEIFTENASIALLAIGVYLTSLLVGLIKFGRIANLHLYLSKFGGLFLYIFLIHAFIFGEYSYSLFLLAGFSFILSSSETLVLQITSRSVDSNMGSIFFRYIDQDHPIRDWLSKLP